MTSRPVLALLACGFALAATTQPAHAATCSLADGVLTVQLSPGETPNIKGIGGILTVGAVACAATADVVEARILGATDSTEKVWLRLGGFTDVAAIQWSVDLRTGLGDTIRISATSAGSTIRAASFADGTQGIDLDQNAEIDIALIGVNKGEFFGGGGNDRFYGTLPGVAGALPFAGTLLMEGGPGNDVLVGGSNRDTLSGEEGDDEIYGRDGSDFLSDGPGDNLVDGGRGDEIIYCDPGSDTYLGRDGGELFITEEADSDDLIDGGAGPDRIQYLRSNDVTVNLSLGVGGEAGESDTLVSIYGVSGGLGNDTLIGDDQDNLLSGHEGDDILRGGAGTDELWCGPGDDWWSGNGDVPFDCEHRLPN